MSQTVAESNEMERKLSAFSDQLSAREELSAISFQQSARG
jgi:hypothetical protein